MIEIGDMVKHHKLQSRVGVVIAVDNQKVKTIVVDWFNGNGFMTYRYYPYALIKVSK